MMPPIIFLPIVELAAINLFTADRCCSRKYSGKRTFLTLFSLFRCPVSAFLGSVPGALYFAATEN